MSRNSHKLQAIKLYRSCYLKVLLFCVLCVLFQFVNHGGRRGNTAQALVRWRHPVASSEALDVLHWAMHHSSYCLIRMATDIASNLPAFFVIVNYLFAHSQP